MKGSYKHPITRFLQKSPFSFHSTIIIISLGFYLAFIIIAFLTGELLVVFSSYMHLMQVDFTFTLIIAFYFLDSFYRNWDKKMREMRNTFDVDDDTFESFVEDAFRKMNSPWCILTGLPFIFLSLGCFIFFINPTMPNPLFPVSPVSPLWIYFGVLQFSIFMLTLLGIGVWICFQAILTARNLGKTIPVAIKPITYDRAGGFLPFSDAILKGVIMYSLIIAIVLPALVFLVNYLQSFNPLLTYLPIISLGLVIVTIGVFFILPQFYIHNIMVEEKDKHLKQVSDEINFVLENVRKAIQAKPIESALPSQQLLLVTLQLTELFNQIERMKTWPSSLTVIAKAIAALGLICITFLLEHIFLFIIQTSLMLLP